MKSNKVIHHPGRDSNDWSNVEDELEALRPLSGKGLSTAGNRWGIIPNVADDGVMEVGRYIDFHHSDANAGDFDVRFDPTVFGASIVNAASAAAANAILGTLAGVAIQAFTADGTYAPTPGMKYCLVIPTGGGGGSGGADGTDTGMSAGAGAGGAGETRIGLFTAADIGASKAVGIGAGGTAGADTGGDGGTGGTTTFGALLSATGGTGGLGLSTGSQGAAEGGGDGGSGGAGGLIGIPGGDGGFGHSPAAGTMRSVGGTGGASFWGGGGRGARLTAAGSAAGQTSKAYGSGAGGAVCVDSTTGSAGAVGTPGICFVIEFI